MKELPTSYGLDGKRKQGMELPMIVRLPAFGPLAICHASTIAPKYKTSLESPDDTLFPMSLGPLAHVVDQPIADSV
jgi:hypothetical protein